MLFSVIIPVYNSQTFLTKCVKSILENKFDDYEIILVDDGSTDDSLKLCYQLQSDYGNKIVVLSKTNGGASSARNYGIKNARGKYLFFLDSDDYWIDSSCFSSVKDKIDSFVEAELILLGAITENSQSGKTRVRCVFTYDEINFLEKASIEKQSEYLLQHHKFPSSAWSVCIKKDFIESHNLYFEEGIVAEDIDWMINAFYKNITITAVTKMVCHYHEQRVGSVTNTAGEKTVNSLLWIVNKWRPILLKDTLHNKTLIRFLAFHYSTIFLAYASLTSQLQKKYEVDIKKHLDLLQFGNSKKTKLIKLIIQLLGVRKGSFMIKKIYSLFLKIK